MSAIEGSTELVHTVAVQRIASPRKSSILI
jgi:hypothetical protein